MSALAIIFFFVLLGAGVGFYFWVRRVSRRRLIEGLRMKLFLVQFPRVGGADAEHAEEVLRVIALSEQLFTALAAPKETFAFEIAVPYVGEEIHFYVAVPPRMAEPFVRQVQSLWPDARVEPTDDYNVFHYGGAVAGATLKQAMRFLVPLRTYRELGSDTFLPILGGLTKVNAVGEGCAIQYLVRPAPRSAKKTLESALKSLKKGMSLKQILGEGGFSAAFADLKGAVASPSKKDETEKRAPPDERAVELLTSKLAKPLFEVNVRAVASAPTPHRAEVLLSELTTGFAQFEAPERNGLKVSRPKHIPAFVRQFSFREWNTEDAMVLTSEEFASVFHMPTPWTMLPHMKSVKSREAPPPAKLPSRGVMIGESVYRGERRPVRLAEEDRRRHLYLVGQTGTGKSTLITSLAAQDMNEGRGVAVIDPHGDLIERLLSLVPPKRMGDVVVFDPSDLALPLGLNMIEHDPAYPEQKTFIVNELLGIFDRLYDLKTTGGPMFEQYMRNALLLLMEDAPVEPATLMEVPRIFTDASFRARKLARITNPTVQDFWEKEAVKAGGEAALQNITPYITSKFAAFTTNDYMRVIVGQTRSAFNFRELMDRGGILLVNLAKGKIGDLNANLLGMIVVGKLLMAALGRGDLTETSRRDFYCFIDEFQNFTTDSIATILSEARKYRLDLTIAHQFLGQLTEKIQGAVFGNVGSSLIFRVGAPDAEMLAKQLGGTFVPDDLTNLDNFRGAMKLLVDGETTPPFSLALVPPEQGDDAMRETVKERSRTRYGRPREEVEREIRERLRK
ncbi:MAG: type IV secretion system DNA-binding domain-containing protein [Candidatus Jorgensenbacteria bacterium]|nr:type IV secretion system DNA-binding domain-containing protein [Candidatus Jorgensenbacteria bacterium]